MAKEKPAPGIPEVLTNPPTSTGQEPPVETASAPPEPTPSAEPSATSTAPAHNPADPRRKFRVSAPDCPKCRLPGQVYGTQPNVRYVKCNRCGHNWKQSIEGAELDPLCDAVRNFCESLIHTDPIPDPDTNRPVIPVPIDDAKKFVTLIASMIPLRKREPKPA